MSVARYTGGQQGRQFPVKTEIGYLDSTVTKTPRFILMDGSIMLLGGIRDGLHTATNDGQDQTNCWVDLDQVITNSNAANDSTFAPSKISLGGYSTSEYSKAEVAELIASKRCSPPLIDKKSRAIWPTSGDLPICCPISPLQGSFSHRRPQRPRCIHP